MLKLAFNHPLPPRRLKRCTCMRFWRMCHSHQTLGLMVCVNVFAISVGIFALINLYNLFMKLKRKSECFRVHFVHITYTAWEKVFYVADNLMKNSAAWQRFPATVFGWFSVLCVKCSRKVEWNARFIHFRYEIAFWVASNYNHSATVPRSVHKNTKTTFPLRTENLFWLKIQN